MRWNLKEAVSKSLVRRTEITYKAKLREISWHKATKSDNRFILLLRVKTILHQSSIRKFTLDGWIELDKKRRITIPALGEYHDDWMEDIKEKFVED